MARKSSRPAAAAAPRSSSKRAAPQTPSRQSKRAKSTAKKSYTEPESDDALPSEEDSVAVSDFEAENDVDPSSESVSNEADSDDNNGVATAASRGRSTKRKDTKEGLWKSGAKLELGTRIIIKKPKAREAGDVPYTDDTIHPNTMLFLRDLAAHNDRQWLKAHDADYRMSLQDFTTFLGSLSEKVIEADETIPELPVKDIIFRIYRDVRFSKDQTPYKVSDRRIFLQHGAGRKGPYAAYYVHVEPKGSSFIGGGLWMPEASALAALRRDIDRKPHKIKSVLMDAGIRREFFGEADNEAKAVKAFLNQPSNLSNALKKHPKGYDANHKDIELLRLRNFTLGTKLSDDELVGTKGLDRIAELIGCMVPFITYLNSVVMPDKEESDSSEEDDADSSNEDVDEDGA